MDETVDRVRRHLAQRSDVTQSRIIGGGVGFIVGGNLCCGVTARGLVVRVGPDDKPSLLALPHVVPHRVGGRETAAFILIEANGYRSDPELGEWIERGLRFVASLE